MLRSGRQALPAKFDELRNYLPKAEACAQAAKQLPVPVGVMIAGNDAVIMPFQVEATAAYFGVEAITLEGAAHDLQLVSHLMSLCLCSQQAWLSALQTNTCSARPMIFSW